LQDRNLVIVVDRDDAVLKSVARLLWSFGYDSVLFSSAEAFANHNDFDEVICAVIDIGSGDVSGIELRHALQAANISVPVIYMTGNDSPAVRKAALQSRGVAYLIKPFSVASLAEKLRRLRIRTVKRNGDKNPSKRIRLSALGKERSPRITTHTGIIVGKTPGSDTVRILLDGHKLPITLHKSYIEPQ
jgi:FixJ family two-component response regulator